jgi:hypothetical protein
MSDTLTAEDLQKAQRWLMENCYKKPWPHIAYSKKHEALLRECFPGEEVVLYKRERQVTIEQIEKGQGR